MNAQLKKILDPLGHGIPRRAAVDPHTGLVVDKVQNPKFKEVDALSEICHLVFDTEPRDPAKLLHRALVLNVATAWEALRDDVSLGITYKVAGDDVGHVIRCLLTHPTESQAYVCSAFIAANPLEKWSFDFNVVAHHLAALESDVVCEAFQKVMSIIGISTQHAARLITEHPRTCRLFLSLAKLAEVHMYAPNIVDVLVDYATTLRPAARYPPLAFLATLCHAGVHVPPDVGIDTMIKLRKTTYDAKIAAAAAVIIQGASDEATRAFGNVIESLAAHLQKMATQETRGPSN